MQREGNESSPHCDGSAPQPYRTRDARPRLPPPASPRGQGRGRPQTAGLRRRSRSCCCRDRPHSGSPPTCTDAPWDLVSIVDLFKCDRVAGKGKERAELRGGREGGRKRSRRRTGAASLVPRETQTATVVATSGASFKPPIKMDHSSRWGAEWKARP